MNHKTTFRRSRPMVLAVLLGTVTVANATDDKDWSFSGFLDTYYQYDSRKPSEPLLFGRQFDIYRDRGSIAVGQLNVAYKPSNSHAIGFVANLTVGKNAELINLGEPANRAYEAFHQLYATYTFGGKTPITVDLGKFSTPIGYEVAESINNDQHSRSFVYTFAQPIYHTGVRVSAPLTSKLTGTAIIAQGWNEVEDSGKNKAGILSVAYVASSKTTIYCNYYLAEEGSKFANDNGIFGGFGFTTDSRAKVCLFDASVVHQATDKLKVGVNGTYGTANHASGASFEDSKFYGVAGYAKYQLSPELGLSFRADTFNDDGGVRSGTDGLSLSSFTAGADYTFKKNVVFRLEFRRDAANRAVFADDGTGANNRSTFTFAVAFKF
ncbi:MAG: porin [Chlorobia bacterium]|nr:porin [Fimbriimonadaceae bacterium]